MLEEQFLLNSLKKFYAGHSAQVPDVAEREFGIGAFGKKIANRHLSFASQQELNSFCGSKHRLLSHTVWHTMKSRLQPQ